MGKQREREAKQTNYSLLPVNKRWELRAIIQISLGYLYVFFSF